MHKYFIVFSILLFSSSIYAAGFDCAKAGTKVEKLICGDPTLSELDSKLSSLYSSLHKHLRKSKFDGVRSEQRKWVMARNKLCVSSESCIALYKRRIEIFDILNKWSDVGETITPQQLYMRFNMRTILSSYGQRVKYYCGTYPFEYFSKDQMRIKGKNTLILDNGDDYWELKINGNTIEVLNQIKSGTYNASASFPIKFDRKYLDYRAQQTYIKKDSDCAIYIVQ